MNIFLRSKKAIYSTLSSVSAGLLKTMRTYFVILLLICISLMYTVQAQSNTTTAVSSTTSAAPQPSGSENCVATLNILVMTLVTVFILQAKDWFC